MPGRKQVEALLVEGLTWTQIGQRLGIPAGQAYLIGTGAAADGSGPDTEGMPRRPGVLPAPQFLVNPPHENPAQRESVHRWMRARVAADAPMRRAAAQQNDGKD